MYLDPADRFRRNFRKAVSLMLLAAMACGLYLTAPTSPVAAGDGGPHIGKAASDENHPQGNTSCQISFTDVHTGDYFYDAVQYLYCAGAVGGYADGTFRPGNNTTRGQLSKILVIAMGWPLVNPPAPSFLDVPPGSTFYIYIETARAHGVLGGYEDGTFRPNAGITRGQLSKAVVLARGWPLQNPPSPTFIDVPAGSAFYTYIQTAVAHGVVSGYSDGTFRPGNPATRGQIAKIVYIAITGNTGPRLTTEEQQTVDLINQRRAAVGLGTLRVDVALTNAARRHSNDIGPLGLCQHEGTDGSSPWDRIAQAGYTGFGLGEVVACNFSSAQEAVQAWWDSPGHYAVLTDPNAHDIGCGWWMGPNGYGWVTCDTGSR
jgi:uncharacterized protein YkwD